MALLSIGISHKRAPVALREKVAIPAERMESALKSLMESSGCDSAVILSTCNRTELYCKAAPETLDSLCQWLAAYNNIDINELQPHLYHQIDLGAIKHLFRVAAGLDSLVLGEPQILGQLKSAYQGAQGVQPLNTHLDRLFQNAFSVAKSIRSSTELGKNPVSVAFAAVSLAKQIFGKLHKREILLIGAGETIELTARHLYHNGVGEMTIANRSLDNAAKLAEPFQANICRLNDINEHLATADIVISATASDECILTAKMLKEAFVQRKRKILYLVDLAIPRDIDPEINDFEDAYLYTVDDLQDVIDENIKARKKAAIHAEEIVEYQSEQFIGWLRQQSFSQVIHQYREQSDALKDEVLEKALAMVASGKPAEEAMTFLANTLSKKLCHLPSTVLREAGRDGQSEVVNQFARQLNLKNNEKKT